MRKIYFSFLSVMHDDVVSALLSEHSLLGIHHQHQQHPHQQQQAQQHSGSSLDRSAGGGGLTPKTPGSPNTVRSADTPFEGGAAPGTPVEGGLTAVCRTPSEDDRGTPRSRGVYKVFAASVRSGGYKEMSSILADQ
jgi:hypothetical protein